MVKRCKVNEQTKQTNNMYTMHTRVHGYVFYKYSKVSVVQTSLKVFYLIIHKNSYLFCMSAFGDEEYPLSNKG